MRSAARGCRSRGSCGRVRSRARCCRSGGSFGRMRPAYGRATHQHVVRRLILSGAIPSGEEEPHRGSDVGQQYILPKNTVLTELRCLPPQLTKQGDKG
eukprot:COSAG03_NODE_308_length_9136_cov_3.444285_5_plen_98_part_00